MNRYICIHGHFYQPPRENPWIETIELQDAAYPYHDWNKRITAECYAPNARSRILDEKGRIVRIVNNYARISFNFGPTLLAWLEKNSRGVYEAILEADQESRKLFSGHGSALAQAYNHVILPLANTRDKHTQVAWGIEDFKHRFSRDPEGMWLPETAVDLETLDIMAGLGIRFTILSPLQAGRVRPSGESTWKDVSGGEIDPTLPYTLHLPSGRQMALFFYNGEISRAVAFEKLLSSGETFAGRVVGGFSEAVDGPQLVHIATDGESYGHHHRFGDMALAYALDVIESNHLGQLTNYGAYLEKHPPAQDVEILENTSWSCAHGVERWQGDCGCNTGRNPAWHQGWRKFLREALDGLRVAITPPFEEKGRTLFKDPWEARNQFFPVILDRTDETIQRFLDTHAQGTSAPEGRTEALRLMELQRHAMLMYTSCGWFFDDLSGIETVQILQYAGRVIQLGGELFGLDFESGFLEKLEQARSNEPEKGDGRKIYEKSVRPAMVDLRKACAYDAIGSLFDEASEEDVLCCYRAEREDYKSYETGSAKLVLGKSRVTSDITGESSRLDFGVLHLGDHNLNCGVREYQGEEMYRALLSEVSGAFEEADFPETWRCLDRHFGGALYSLKSLYRDEQRRIINLILKSTLEGIEAVYRQLYDQYAPIMLFLKDSESPPPRALAGAADLVVNADLVRALEQEDFDLRQIVNLLERADQLGVSIEKETMEYVFRKNLEGQAERLSANPTDLLFLEKLDQTLDLLDDLPFQTNLWSIQNICFDILGATYPELRMKADQGEEDARQWVDRFHFFCGKLSVLIS